MKKTISTLLMAASIFGVSARDIDISNQSDVNRMVMESFEAFKANKLKVNFSSGGQAYIGWMEANSNNYRYYWEQNLCMMATEDLAEFAGNRTAIHMSDDLCRGFKIHYGDNWGLGWNEYIDDQLWLALSLIRGYRVSGNEEWLEGAKTVFDTLFERGCHGPGDMWADVSADDGSKGLWWMVKPNVHTEINNFYYVVKSPLSNSGVAALGAYIYRETGDESYLTKAKNIWNWVATTLYDHYDNLENAGQPKEGVSEGWHPEYHGIYSGEQRDQKEYVQGRRTLHDHSTFFEATNALYQATGDEKYMDWCETIIFDIVNRRLDANGYFKGWHDNAAGGLSSDGYWCWEAARAFSMFVVENDLWDLKTVTRKVGDSPLTGNEISFPNGWTIYEWMCAQAVKLVGNNSTCIVLPLKEEFTSANYLEAEDADFESTNKNALQVVDDPMCSGGKRVTNFLSGNTVTFHYDAPEAGVYTVVLGYSMRTPASNLKVTVNGNEPDTFSPATTSGSSNNMGQTSLVLVFRKGNNDITIEQSRQTYSVDLDYLYVIPENGYWDSAVYEAEDAALAGGAKTKVIPSSIYGDKTVVTGAVDGGKITFSVDVPLSGCYDMTVAYASKDAADVIASTADADYSATLPSTGNNRTVKEETVKINLKQGANQIALTNAPGSAADFDFIALTLSGETDPELAGIEGVLVAEDTADDAWYTLMGVKIAEPASPGIYIHNKRKVIVK